MESRGRESILYTLKILYEHTDQEHPMTADEFTTRLSADYGIKAYRATLARDIALLKNFGIDIEIVRGTQNMYYISRRSLDAEDIKVLIDAVLSSAFITEKKSKMLVHKLTGLVSFEQAKQLKRHMFITDRTKTASENLYFGISDLQNAINSGKKVTFNYFEYTADKQKVYKHDGKKYVFSPYTLSWDGGNYYVFGFSDTHNKIIKFRVDRIDNLCITEHDSVPMDENFNMPAYIKSVFNMSDGQEVPIELKCRNETMKFIVDRFGESIQTEKYDDEHFIAKTTVSAGPSFYAWIFSFSGKIQILSPTALCRRYKEMLDSCLLTT